MRFVKKDGSGVSLRYGYIDSFPFDGRSRIQVLHARWTVTITGWGWSGCTPTWRTTRRGSCGRATAASSRGDEGVTTIDIKEVKG